jgi:hypothetical protein
VQAAQVKALACELPAEHGVPLSRWSAADLADEAVSAGIVDDVSASTVARWLAADAIKPWQHRSWIFPRDPQFAVKAGAVLDLYARCWQGRPLGEDEFVMSADDKTSIQARCRCHPSMPPGRARLMRVEHEYQRGGALAYVAALDVHHGGRRHGAAWLTPRGLAFNEDKTRVVDLDEGYDFLGFTVRRYHGLLLIKPSKTAVRRIRKRLRTEVRALRGSNAAAVIARLNPIIRGWAAYYRTVVSSEIFNALDHYLWKLVYKWARHSHPNKPTSWVVARYFGMFNKSRRDRWVFGDRDSGAYLQKFTWTRIVRHQMVPGTASPDDAALADYWHTRRRRPRTQPPVDRTTQQLFDSQQGRCAYCGQLLLHADRPPQTPREWEQWYGGLRKAMDHNAISLRQDGSHDPRLRLLHTHCRRWATGKRQASTLHASTP